MYALVCSACGQLVHCNGYLLPAVRKSGLVTIHTQCVDILCMYCDCVAIVF